MRPKILVFYGTTDGHTPKIATVIADTLRGQNMDVELLDASDRRDVSPVAYTGIIVAASVHAGGYQRAVREWVRRNARALAARPSAFVSVCLGVLEHKPETDRALQHILAQFSTLTGWQPAETKIIAGALLYTKYNWLKRWMMRRIVAKAGGDTDTSRDYEYTNWDDVHAFARTFGTRCQPALERQAG